MASSKDTSMDTFLRQSSPETQEINQGISVVAPLPHTEAPPDLSQDRVVTVTVTTSSQLSVPFDYGGGLVPEGTMCSDGMDSTLPGGAVDTGKVGEMQMGTVGLEGSQATGQTYAFFGRQGEAEERRPPPLATPAVRHGGQPSDTEATDIDAPSPSESSSVGNTGLHTTQRARASTQRPLVHLPLQEPSPEVMVPTSLGAMSIRVKAPVSPPSVEGGSPTGTATQSPASEVLQGSMPESETESSDSGDTMLHTRSIQAETVYISAADTASDLDVSSADDGRDASEATAPPLPRSLSDSMLQSHGVSDTVQSGVTHATPFHSISPIAKTPAMMSPGPRGDMLGDTDVEYGDLDQDMDTEAPEPNIGAHMDISSGLGAFSEGDTMGDSIPPPQWGDGGLAAIEGDSTATGALIPPVSLEDMVTLIQQCDTVQEGVRLVTSLTGMSRPPRMHGVTDDYHSLWPYDLQHTGALQLSETADCLSHTGSLGPVPSPAPKRVNPPHDTSLLSPDGSRTPSLSPMSPDGIDKEMHGDLPPIPPLLDPRQISTLEEVHRGEREIVLHYNRDHSGPYSCQYAPRVHIPVDNVSFIRPVTLDPVSVATLQAEIDRIRTAAQTDTVGANYGINPWRKFENDVATLDEFRHIPGSRSRHKYPLALCATSVPPLPGDVQRRSHAPHIGVTNRTATSVYKKCDNLFVDYLKTLVRLLCIDGRTTLNLHKVKYGAKNRTQPLTMGSRRQIIRRLTTHIPPIKTLLMDRRNGLVLKLLFSNLVQVQRTVLPDRELSVGSVSNGLLGGTVMVMPFSYTDKPSISGVLMEPQDLGGVPILAGFFRDKNFGVPVNPPEGHSGVPSQGQTVDIPEDLRFLKELTTPPYSNSHPGLYQYLLGLAHTLRGRHPTNVFVDGETGVTWVMQCEGIHGY
ncbi:hypothetical protein KIPB_003575 [Kipferlia bialata]|uniref:Uncharacterized protein n=1 Tax=Kipferlia bialata TaxID=797122 RepID=A0A9K3GH58_9EUKA|nr:hypothetical protein KIPB_003575 [Kipferlia bialata]|eukprot:g3575.t1